MKRNRKPVKIPAIEHERSGVTADGIRPHLKAEAARLWELYGKKSSELLLA